jgi:hypothetical protein
MWICAVCAEEVEDNFDACWNCQTTRGGRRPAQDQETQESEDDRLKAIVNLRHKPKKCLHCSGDLVHAGTKKFHQGTHFGVFGDLGELLVDQESLDMYVCNGCGHVEFFKFES